MAYIRLGEKDFEITDSEYRRLRNTARGRDWRILDSGVIINLAVFSYIVPSGQPVEEAEPELEEPEEIEEEEEEQAHRLTGKEIQTLQEESGLSKSAFAASVGYTPSTLRLATQEGRVSQEFSDAVTTKYGESKG